MFQFDDGLGQEWAWLEPPFEDLHYHGATRELECPTSSKHGGYPIYGAQPWARSSAAAVCSAGRCAQCPTTAAWWSAWATGACLAWDMVTEDDPKDGQKKGYCWTPI